MIYRMGGFFMNNIQDSHINIENRSEIQIKGVKDVVCYDSEKIIFKMNDEELILNGENFNIKKIDLDNSLAIVSGLLYSLNFSGHTSKSSKSFLKSLFK